MSRSSTCAGRADHESGFTLIEMLMVIVVLGLVTALAVLDVIPVRKGAETASCRTDLRVVQAAAGAFEARRGRFPASIDELVQGGYLKEYPTGTSATTDGTFVFVTDSPPTTVIRPC